MDLDYLSSLNDNQRKAVQTTEGYLRVIAGAGSGKTKLLVSRYAYLVKEYGIDPANILCVTFTNKAAGEMKRRVRKLLGGAYHTTLICTYHGFCVRVLRDDIEKMFYPKDFQIIDTSQQKSILGDIYQKYERKLDYASFEKILKSIANIKAQRKYVQHMRAPYKCQILEQIVSSDDQIIEEYLQRQKQIYALDFQDLIYFTLDIFARFPDVLAKWQDRLNYIQVDEFQDSSTVEMELIDQLSQKYHNVMIVGDPDQNIYEWRGSDVKLLVDFDTTHCPTQTIFLNRNYRSTPQILNCANTLIDHNRMRLKKDLFTKQRAGHQVIHYHTKNEYEEAEKIVENITAIRREEHASFADFAVLYRAGFLSRIIEKKFTESGIPYEIFGGVKFYHRAEIQDIVAYLRLIVLDDDAAFKRIVNLPRRRFGRVKMQHLLSLQQEGSLYETLSSHLNDPVFANSDIGNFVPMIDNLRTASTTLTLSEFVEKVCADSGYEAYIRTLGDMERFENLSEFKRISDEYEKNFGEHVSPGEFLQQIALQSNESETEDDTRDLVKLMTIHAAKGLEFPYVFVVGMSEGIFPSSKTLEERKEMGLEEERRLCYVAITRAQRRLFLMDSEGFTQNEKQKLPSRFLQEIGEQNYTRIGTISKELQEQADQYAAQLCTPTPEHTDHKPLEVGDSVQHPAFGTGKILSFGKNNQTMRVYFERLSATRDISANYFSREHTLPTVPSHEPLVPNDVPPPAVTEEKNIATDPVPLTVDESKNMKQISDDTPSEQPNKNDEKPAEICNGDPVPSMAASHEQGLENIKNVAIQDTSLSDPTKTMPEAKTRLAPPAQDAQQQSEKFSPQGIQLSLMQEDTTPPTPTQVPQQTPAQTRTPSPSHTTRISDNHQNNLDKTAFSDPAVMSNHPDTRVRVEHNTEKTAIDSCPVAKTSEQKEHSDIEPNVPPKTTDTENLWERPDVPKTGWYCVGITDLGAPIGICGMCGHQNIRYVHHMVHPHFPRKIGAGCVCSGRMEGNIETARRREQQFKNKQKRLENFLARSWKISRNQNAYLKIRGHLLILCQQNFRNSDNKNSWKYALDHNFCHTSFPDMDACKRAAFEALEQAEAATKNNASKENG